MTDTNGQLEVSVPYKDANELSVRLLSLLEEDAHEGVREVACAMTLGRLLAWPRVLEPDEEQHYVEAVLDFSASMWPDGSAN